MENFDEHYKQRKEDAEEKAAQLARVLMRAGRQDDLIRASEDAKYREILYKEFEI